MRIDSRNVAVGVVFLVAFVAAVLAMQGGAPLQWARAPDDVPSASTLARHPGQSSMPGEPGAGEPRGAAAPAPAPREAPILAPSPERVAELRHQALDATEGEQRFEAIQELETGAASTDTLETLDRVLQDSTDLRERLAAVQVLGRLAKMGDPGGRIHRLIQNAASDPNEYVAASARDLAARMSVQ